MEALKSFIRNKAKNNSKKVHKTLGAFHRKVVPLHAQNFKEYGNKKDKARIGIRLS